MENRGKTSFIHTRATPELARVAAASSPAPAQFDNHLEQWQGPRGGVDLSRFARDGVAALHMCVP